jgi:hypothetical protein
MGNIYVVKCQFCNIPYYKEYDNPIIRIHHVNKHNCVRVCIKCLKHDNTRLRLNEIYSRNGYNI